MKFKTPEFVSKMKKRLNKGMNRFFSIIPPKYLVGAAGVVFIIVLFNSCKKQTDCIPGAKSNANPNGIQKSPKSPKSDDPCAGERAARDEAADNQIIYDDNVRGAIGPAASGIEGNVWSSFADYWGESYDPTNHTIIDTVYGMRYGIRLLWKDYGDPFPINGAEIQILYNYCGIDSVGYDDLQTKQGDLDDCEKVGIDEYGWMYICNEKGYWVPYTGR